MDAIQIVHVFQASGGIQQLVRREERLPTVKKHLTNFNLLAYGKRARYSLKLPYCALAEIIERGKVHLSMPRKGNIFGWVKFPQVTISL